MHPATEYRRSEIKKIQVALEDFQKHYSKTSDKFKRWHTRFQTVCAFTAGASTILTGSGLAASLSAIGIPVCAPLIAVGTALSLVSTLCGLTAKFFSRKAEKHKKNNGLGCGNTERDQISHVSRFEWWKNLWRRVPRNCKNVWRVLFAQVKDSVFESLRFYRWPKSGSSSSNRSWEGGSSKLHHEPSKSPLAFSRVFAPFGRFVFNFTSILFFPGQSQSSCPLK